MSERRSTNWLLVIFALATIVWIINLRLSTGALQRSVDDLQRRIIQLEQR